MASGWLGACVWKRVVSCLGGVVYKCTSVQVVKVA